MWRALPRIWKHRWLDSRAAARALPTEALARLAALVAQSEKTHTGEIRIAIEGGLPLSYLRRQASPRERALSLFGKLRVWDTEHNNGALIYLLLADHAIEIVADRALDRTMSAEQWQTLISDMQSAFQSGHFSVGLVTALERVSQQLTHHFPRKTGAASGDTNLPDAPVVQHHLPSRKP